MLYYFTKEKGLSMKALHVENLAIIVTEKCNLDCGHCLRGEKSNKSISKEVIDATFDQIKAIDLLNICGGEPPLALEELAYLFRTMIVKRIFLKGAFITINGTIYNERFMSLVEMLDTYIKGIDPSSGVKIGISYDDYHHASMTERGLSYDNRNFQTPFYCVLRVLDGSRRIFREGNAENLDVKLTKPFKPLKTIILDYGNSSKYLSHCIGPLVTINMDGTITEDNTTYKKQSTIYNYGNIKTDDLVESLLAHGARLTKRRFIYRYVSTKEKRLFLAYDK